MREPKILVDLSYLIYFSMHSSYSSFCKEMPDLVEYKHDFDPGIHEEYLHLLKRRFNKK